MHPVKFLLALEDCAIWNEMLGFEPFKAPDMAISTLQRKIKMKIRFALAAVSFLLCFFSLAALPKEIFAGESDNGIAVITPINNSLVDIDALIIQGRAQQGTEIPYSIDNAAGRTEQSVQAEWGDVFEIFALLAPGVNTIEINGQKLNVFYAFEENAPPEGFRIHRLHSGDISRCDHCHNSLLNVKKLEVYKECLKCHVITSENPDNSDDPAQTRHFRVSTAECGLCHESHSSMDRKLLKAAPDEACGACHPRRIRDMRKENAHPAFKKLGCATCHDPHYSGYDKGLRRPLPALCNECHDVAIDASPENIHPALRQERSCVSCHNPHGSNPNLLRAEETTLCSACHPQIIKQGHKDTLRDCLNCHDAHGLYLDGMLKRQLTDACEKCHENMTKGTTVHHAVFQGCQLCHQPHRDDDVREAGIKCPSCHSVKSDEWDSLHGNLNIPLEKCVGCHPPHSSNSESLVRANMHFPLTQGKCTICHGGGDEDGTKIHEVERRCRMCHPFEQEMKARGAAIHDPVKEGLCTNCHDPHMSNLARFLTKPIPALCIDCHEDVLTDKSGPHKDGPKEKCDSCHFAHGGENEFFLK